jgi:hypothetical protein
LPTGRIAGAERAGAANRIAGCYPSPADHLEESTMRTAFLVPLLGVALPAQTITRTAAAATALTVSVQGVLSGNQTQSLPAGTALLDGTTLSAVSFGALARLHVAMPSPFAYHLDGFANTLEVARFNGDTLVTFATSDPTAAVLDLAVTRTTGSIASIDVGNDGTVELPSPAGSSAQLALPVRFGPAPLLVRTSTSGLSSENAAETITVDVALRERLTTVLTRYLAGCGPTIAIAPADTQTVHVDVGGMPPAALAFAVIGVGRASTLLPFGGCLLGLTTEWPLRVQLDPTGAGGLDVAVPRAVTGVTLNVQAVGLDFVSSPNVVATTDAIAVRLTR